LLAAAGEETDGVYFGGRGFGSTMTALVDYLGSEYGTTFALGMGPIMHTLVSKAFRCRFFLIAYLT
jgi:hypothetical protein